MPRINILELRDSPWVCGPGRTILETAARINSEKYGCHIGAFCRKDFPSNPFLKAALDRNLRAYRLEESHGLDISSLLKALNLVKTQPIDIIHTHEVRSDIIGLIIGKATGLPVVATLHGWIQNDFKGKIYTMVDKILLRFFHRVIVVSERMQAEVLRCGVPPERVTVLHNALVLENYQRDTHDRSFRRELGVPDHVLLVGNIGRLSPEKGQADFIRAAHEALARHQDARFILVGTGEDRQKLEELAVALGIHEKLFFAGYRANMLPIYNSLDLLVQSSFTEGMPNVVLEAFAMEVPVIATDVGGTAEAVIHNETGILVKPGRPEEIACHILNYIGERNAFEIMVRNARKLVQTKFSFEERTRRLSELYDSLYRSCILQRREPVIH